MHATIGLCCCGYLVIISVQPTDCSVNMLFDSHGVGLVILYWADFRNERSKVIGGSTSPSIFCVRSTLLRMLLPIRVVQIMSILPKFREKFIDFFLVFIYRYYLYFTTSEAKKFIVNYWIPVSYRSFLFLAHCVCEGSRPELSERPRVLTRKIS